LRIKFQCYLLDNDKLLCAIIYLFIYLLLLFKHIQSNNIHIYIYIYIYLFSFKMFRHSKCNHQAKIKIMRLFYVLDKYCFPLNDMHVLCWLFIHIVINKYITTVYRNSKLFVISWKINNTWKRGRNYFWSLVSSGLKLCEVFHVKISYIPRKYFGFHWNAPSELTATPSNSANPS